MCPILRPCRAGRFYRRPCADDDSEPHLRYADTMMLDTQRSPRTEVELIDSAAVVADLKALAETHAGRERELRTAVAQRLKAALTEARARAESLLLKDPHGRRCAERLCQVQDEIIRILFEFAGNELYPTQVPSEAERMT